jgi:hypothetical protein
MPEVVSQPGDIQPGDIFEDCRHHPCLCFEIDEGGEAIWGISLVARASVPPSYLDAPSFESLPEDLLLTIIPGSAGGNEKTHEGKPRGLVFTLIAHH